MKSYLIVLITMPLIFGFQIGNAQQKEEKKVIIVKEKKDGKGNVIREEVIEQLKDSTIVVTGKDTEDREIKVTVEVDENGKPVKNIEKEIRVIVKGEQPANKDKKIRIHVKEEDGTEKIMEWNGEGEMPEEMKTHMENVDIKLESEEKIIEQEFRIIKSGGESEDIIILQGMNGIPDDVRERLEKNGIRIENGKALLFTEEGEDEDVVIIKKGNGKLEWHEKEHWQEMQKVDEELRKVERERNQMRKHHQEEMEMHRNEMRQAQQEMREVERELRRFSNEMEEKPVLGVSVETHIDGLVVMEVMAETPARQAGIQPGDVIYKVGKKTVGSVLQLTSALKEHEGQSVKIKVLRNGSKQTLKVQL